MKNVKFLLFISTLTFALILSGCGVKGDLVHPSEQNQTDQQDIQNSDSNESDTASEIIEQEAV